MILDSFRLDGKVAVVTGSSRGLGQGSRRRAGRGGSRRRAARPRPGVRDGRADPAHWAVGCTAIELDLDRHAGRAARGGPVGRRRAGPPRHPGQQRRHHPPRPAAGTPGAGLGRRAGGQPRRGVPPVPGGRPALRRAGRRQDHQRRLDAVVPGRHPGARLRRLQARRRRPHQGVRQRTGRPRRQRQRDRARLHGHRQHRRAARRRGPPAGDPGRASRPAGGALRPTCRAPSSSSPRLPRTTSTARSSPSTAVGSSAESARPLTHSPTERRIPMEQRYATNPAQIPTSTPSSCVTPTWSRSLRAR